MRLLSSRPWILLLALLFGTQAFAASSADLKIPFSYYKLKNGLRVVISEDHSAPLVAVGVYYGTGFRLEPKGQTGFAHLFEHMMFQGSENVEKFEIIKYVESNGGSANGSTRWDYTNYYEQLPSDRVETALWLEADRMRALKVTEENLTNQKDVVMEEVRVNVLNQPYGGFQWIDLWQHANQNWYNAHNGYGDFTDLKGSSLKMAQDFYKTYYAPNNAVLVVSGDVDTPDIKKMIEKHFTEIPSSPLPKKPDVSEPPQTKEKRIQQKDKLANLPAIVLGYHAPEKGTPDFAALSLLNLIINGDESSRLYQRLVKEKQISIDWNGALNWGLGNDFDFSGPMLLTMTGVYKPNSSADDILQNVDAVIAEIQKNGVSEKELRDAKVRFKSNYYDEVSSPLSKAHMLAVFALFEDNPGNVNTALQTYLNVTPEMIKGVAQKYLVPANRTVIDRVPEGGKES